MTLCWTSKLVWPAISDLCQADWAKIKNWLKIFPEKIDSLFKKCYERHINCSMFLQSSLICGINSITWTQKFHLVTQLATVPSLALSWPIISFTTSQHPKSRSHYSLHVILRKMKTEVKEQAQGHRTIKQCSWALCLILASAFIIGMSQMQAKTCFTSLLSVIRLLVTTNDPNKILGVYFYPSSRSTWESNNKSMFLITN